jgi:hypothetical protein
VGQTSCLPCTSNLSETYWQLDSRPFEHTSDERYHFAAASQRGALLKLRYVLENRRGAAVLAGESGLGKTFLVQKLFAELDSSLQGGGLPRGRLTEISGIRGSGRTTLLRRIVEEAVAQSGWVAYIDASRTLAPRDWAHLGAHDGVWMIRPTDPTRAAWCADVLLRCGAFSLVVIDAAPPLTRAIAVRLTRLARESSAALVIAGDEANGGGASAMLSSAVRLRIKRARPVPRAKPEVRGAARAAAVTEGAVRRLSVVIEKGGIHRTVEVSCAIGVARRLCAHPQVPDRRGVAKRETGGPGSERRAASAPVHGVGSGEHTSRAPEPGERPLPRKRRCAEPAYGDAKSAVSPWHARARA